MNNRENVLRALKRNFPERVPFDFTLCPSHVEQFKKKTGTADYMGYYNFPFRFIEQNPSRQKIDYSIYYENLPACAAPLYWNPEWGIMGVQGSVAHFQEMLHPMASFSRVKEVIDYPFPDFMADYRWEGMEKRVQELVRQDLIAVAFMQMTIFEIAWYLRGMERFMEDLVDNRDFAVSLLEKITDIRVAMARGFAQAGCDILMLGDDIATQEDMMMSPTLWREIFKPRLATVIDSARKQKPDILVFYHVDGNPYRVIRDLIEIGVDILNPVQPECIDPFKLKQEFGNVLSFWGTVGTQTTLPFGTVREVKDTCRRLIEDLGDGGGLLLAPTHMIEPDVPWENVVAFLDAVHEFGRY